MQDVGSLQGMRGTPKSVWRSRTLVPIESEADFASDCNLCPPSVVCSIQDAVNLKLKAQLNVRYLSS